MSPEVLSVIIVGVIVGVYLFREHRKSGRYFGKGKHLTSKEKKQLQTYKELYSPITDDITLPSFRKNGYEFEDVALSAQEIPYKPPIPKPTEIKDVKAGQKVKIVIVEKDGDSQRVWVEVLAAKYPVFEGKLLNTPFDIKELENGVETPFHSNHILQIE